MNTWVLSTLIGAQCLVDLVILWAIDTHSTRLVKLETAERIRRAGLR